jgi:hypothetical protein
VVTGVERPHVTRLGQSPAVSVSVSSSSVHSRSDETAAGNRPHDRPPMNAGERPRTRLPGPSPQLESGWAEIGLLCATQRHVHVVGWCSGSHHRQCYSVLGTLLGSGITLLFQQRGVDKSHDFTQKERLRQERLDAYSAYAGALIN